MEKANTLMWLRGASSCHCLRMLTINQAAGEDIKIITIVILKATRPRPLIGVIHMIASIFTKKVNTIAIQCDKI